MQIAALLVCGTLALAVISLVERSRASAARAFARREHVWETERAAMLDRIMYLADKPWGEPPIHPSQEMPFRPMAHIQADPGPETLDGLGGDFSSWE